jgi:hypothetical protein
MVSTTCLVIGFDSAGVPSNIYTGLDLTAALAAAASANAAGVPLVQVFRNPGPPFQEFRPVPVITRVFNTVPPEVQLPSGLAG